MDKEAGPGLDKEAGPGIDKEAGPGMDKAGPGIDETERRGRRERDPPPA
jgi:hypothetical protein